MHPNAIRTLEESGLPYLREIPLVALEGQETLDGPGEYYIRTIDGSKAPGRMTRSAAHAFARKNRGLRSFTAVPFLPSIAGATCILSEGTAYLELVSGHLSGLLLRGYLAARFLFSFEPGRSTLIANASYDQLVSVGGSSLESAPVVYPLPGVDEAIKILRVLESSRLPRSTLTEILLTDAGPTWIDAKPYPWRVDFTGLFGSPMTRVFSLGPRPGSYRLLKPVNWNPSEIPQDVKKTAIVLNGSPLSSHFVSYALERGVLELYS